MWNLFRLVADFLHLASFLILILKIRKSKNCLGLSCKTQELYLLVFCSRYLDLFYSFSHQNFYLIFMKTLFISATAYIIYLMKFEKPYCVSYDALGDDFKHWKFLVPGALVLALIIHRNWTLTDYIWSFSIWLEAIAIFPQLHMLSKIREVENITANYVVALGVYRIFYIFNWIYRYIAEDYLCWTSVLGGILQTVMYGDFLYYYMKSRGKDIISLPV